MVSPFFLVLAGREVSSNALTDLQGTDLFEESGGVASVLRLAVLARVSRCLETVQKGLYLAD